MAFTILVIGSEGFIGSHIVSYYLSKGMEVHGADLFETGSLPCKYHKISRLSPELDEIFSSFQFDVCINAAGSANVPYSVSHPVIDFEANCLDVIKILDGIRRLQPGCKYLHISSAAVYGNPTELPITEASIQRPISPYGFHKLIAENICGEFVSVYGLSTAILRPFSVYGPGLKKQFFWDLFQKIKNTENNEVLLHGTGEESRDYIYISDFLAAVNCIVQNSAFKNNIYNLAAGAETTISHVARIVVEAMNSKVNIIFNGIVRKGDPLNWLADIQEIRSLGFEPAIDIRTGIYQLAGWLKSFK